jgi:hypothetical protein
MARHLEVVYFDKGIAICDDGLVLPITGWFDADNAPTRDWDEAVSFVAGVGDSWYLGKVCDWHPMVVN